MSNLSIEPRTYARLKQFAGRAGISIHAAANEAIENWLDIASDPRLAITALTTIASTQTDSQANLAPLAPLATNVTCINANLGITPHRKSWLKLSAVGPGEIAK